MRGVCREYFAADLDVFADKLMNTAMGRAIAGKDVQGPRALHALVGLGAVEV